VRGMRRPRDERERERQHALQDLQADEQPPPVEDFEGMKDDVAIDERFRGEERGLDRDE